MVSPKQRLSNYLLAASLGLLFAGLSALAGLVGINDRALAGIGLGLVVAGLSLSLAAYEFLRVKPDPPSRDDQNFQ
jgi:hypothetical protein